MLRGCSAQSLASVTTSVAIMSPHPHRSWPFLLRDVHAVGRCLSVCLSVCLSITLVYCIQTAKDIVKRPSQPDSSNILVSWGYPVLPNSKEKRLSAGVKYTGREKFALLDRNRSLSRKRYETRKAHSCYGTLIWSQGSAIDLCQFRWPWVTLKGGTRWVKFSGGSP